jgi:hypothetical protein
VSPLRDLRVLAAIIRSGDNPTSGIPGVTTTRSVDPGGMSAERRLHESELNTAGGLDQRL